MDTAAFGSLDRWVRRKGVSGEQITRLVALRNGGPVPFPATRARIALVSSLARSGGTLFFNPLPTPQETNLSRMTPPMDSLWGNIFRSSEDTVSALLRGIPLFSDLSRRELSAVESILHRREYDPDEVLFHQGDPGVGMYIIQEGTIEILYEPTADTLAELTDGDFFGELSLLNETPRSATAVARTDSVLYGLFRPDLLDLVERDPSLGIQILLRMGRVLSERLVKTNEQVQQLREQLADAPTDEDGL